MGDGLCEELVGSLRCRDDKIELSDKIVLGVVVIDCVEWVVLN